MYTIRDADGRYVGRSDSKAAAHRASRSRSHLGSTVNRAGGAGLEWIRVEGKGKPNINESFQVRADNLDTDAHAKVWYDRRESQPVVVWRANVADEYYEGAEQSLTFDGTSDGLNAAIKSAKKLAAKAMGASHIKSGYKASTPTATESGMDRRLRRLSDRFNRTGSLEWHSAAKRYLERLGAAEWKSQGEPKPRGRYPRRQSGYVPTEYHRSLIEFLNKNDEEGFKALKLQEGYASAVGV